MPSSMTTTHGQVEEAAEEEKETTCRRDTLRAHLRALSERRLTPASHVAYLERLKASGFEPAVIYDIGACVLHWTREARRLWPRARIIAFDAFEPAQFLWREQLGGDDDYHLGVLSDADGREVRFHQNDMDPGGNSYYREIGSAFAKDVFPSDRFTVMRASRLDTVVRERGFPKPDLVKIDVQGAELDVLRGGLESIGAASRLIVELQRVQYNEGAELVDTSLPAIEAMGWRCVAPLFTDNGPDGDYGFERDRGKEGEAKDARSQAS